MPSTALELISPEPTNQEFFNLIHSITNPNIIKSIYKAYDRKQKLEAAHKQPEIYTGYNANDNGFNITPPQYNKTDFVDDIYENDNDGKVELKGTLADKLVYTIEEIKGYLSTPV